MWEFVDNEITQTRNYYCDGVFMCEIPFHALTESYVNLYEKPNPKRVKVIKKKKRSK